MKFHVRNSTRGTVLGTAIESAENSKERNVGLLKHTRLEPGAGLWIVPCEGVHTFFMKFPIDLVYVDRKLCVRKVRHAVQPWRASFCISAHSIFELPAGVIAETQTVKGDLLEMQKCA